MLKRFEPEERQKNPTIREIDDMCRKGEVLRALKAARRAGQGRAVPQDILDAGFRKMYFARRYGEILSIYYSERVVGPYRVADLLRELYRTGQYATFLKQAHRCGVYREFAEEIEEAIKWHACRGLPDSAAWQRKFDQLRTRGEAS